MFVRISNAPRSYTWGSQGRISALLGAKPSGEPEAELWLGAHPGSPARIDGGGDLRTWIDADTATALGSLSQLPYLLKVLAAGSPLSLQVHPTRAHAIAQFAKEDAAGIPRDAPQRNYRDANHKPEMIVALEDGFQALCGVRPLAEREAIVAELGLADALDARDLRATIADLLTNRGGARVTELVQLTAARAGEIAAGVSTLPPAATSLNDRVSHDSGRSRHELAVERRGEAPKSKRATTVFAESYRWAERLNQSYPGDPGVIISLFLNLATLRAGEALYLPAGNLHAYLSGLGIEVMASSDNVLRGGLTPKHIDVPELLAVAEVEALPLPTVTPERNGDAATYRGEASEFELVFVEGAATVPLTGPAIVLNLSGASAVLSGARTSESLDHGHAVFVTHDEQHLAVQGARVVIAQPQASYVELTF